MNSRIFNQKTTGRILLILLLLMPGYILSSNPDEPFNQWLDLSYDANENSISNEYLEYVKSGNTIHLLWVAYKYLDEAQLYYRRSVDNGETWESPKLLFDFVYKNSAPASAKFTKKIAIHGQKVHIAFADFEQSTLTGKIYYMRSDNGGASFSAPRHLHSVVHRIENSIIRADGNRIGIVCDMTGTGRNSGIVLLHSRDSGESFTDTLLMQRDRLYHDKLAEFHYKDNRMIILHSWGGSSFYGSLYASVSKDYGETFITHTLTTPREEDGTEQFLFQPYQYNGMYFPQELLTVSGNNIHIIYIHRDSNNIYYVRSRDGGNSFEPQKKIHDGLGKTNPYPTIAAGGDKLYLSYIHRDASGTEIAIRKSTDNGKTFSDPVFPVKDRISHFTIPSEIVYPIIDPHDAGGNTIHLVGNLNMLATSVNGGESFDHYLALNSKINGGEKSFTDVIIDEDGVMHFFNNYRYAYNSPGRILYYKYKPAPEPSSENHSLKIYEEADNPHDNARLSIPASPSLNFESAITAEAWVKFNNTMQQGTQWGSAIILKNKSQSFYYNRPDGFQLVLYPAKKRENGIDVHFFEVNAAIETDKGSFHFMSPDRIDDFLWHHLAFTYDENGGMNNFRLYVDGVLKAEQTAIGKIDAGNGLIHAGLVTEFNKNLYDYEVDDVRLWSRALSQEEIRANVHRKEFGEEEDLKLFLNFDNTLKDMSGYGNDAFPAGCVTMTPTILDPPEADFELYRNLDEIALNDRTRNGKAVKWSFGDSKLSTDPNPKYKYSKAGEYIVTMQAANDNSVVSAAKPVTIAGLDRIFPEKAGNAGFVTLDVYGGGLTDKNTTISLRMKGRSDLTGIDLRKHEDGYLQCKIPLHGAETGKWDVVVKTNNTEQSLKSAFTIEKSADAKPWVSISSRDVVLLNRYTTYTINFGNKGNVDAYYVPLWVAITKSNDLDVAYLDFEMTAPEHFIDDPGLEAFRSEIGEYFETDMFDGKEMNVRVYPLQIPVIRSNSSGSYSFRIKSSEDFEIFAVIERPWYTENMSGNDNPDPDSPLKAAAVTEEQAWCAASTFARSMGDLATTLIPGTTCIWEGLKTTYDVGAYAMGSSRQSAWNLLWNVGVSAANCGISLAKDLAFPVKWGMYVVNMTNYAYDLLECMEPRDDDKKRVRTVSSFDPNEMVGPNGYGDENWISPRPMMPYTILFENISTATAPAHEVLVTDTLNIEKFDLSKFSFGSFGWGKHVFNQTTENVKEFSQDIDLRPDLNTIVRVSGKLDTLKGIVSWSFISFDPATMDLHEDPLLGFLPPNADDARGEGFVSFYVGLKPITSTGESVSNRANIIFDTNEPIMTNDYVNTFDLSLPESRVVSAESDDGENIVVKWEGGDTGSGIKHYTIWMQKNDEEPEPLFIQTEETRGTFMGEKGASYKLYSLADDNCNNREIFLGSYEVNFVFSDVKEVKQEENWFIYPNPARDYITLQLHNAPLINDYLFNVIDLTGKSRISSKYRASDVSRGVQLNVSDLPAGYYIVRINYGDYSVSRKLIIE